MIPLTRYSTAFATIEEDDADPLRLPAGFGNEDTPDRIVRKLLHMVRNRAYDRRKFNVMLPGRFVRASKVILQGKVLDGVTAEVLSSKEDINYAYCSTPQKLDS